MIIDPTFGRTCVTTEPMPAGAYIVEMICPDCAAVVPVSTLGVRDHDAVAAAVAHDCPLHNPVRIPAEEP